MDSFGATPAFDRQALAEQLAEVARVQAAADEARGVGAPSDDLLDARGKTITIRTRVTRRLFCGLVTRRKKVEHTLGLAPEELGSIRTVHAAVRQLARVPDDCDILLRRCKSTRTVVRTPSDLVHGETYDVYVRPYDP
jgi:hypothetical protein